MINNNPFLDMYFVRKSVNLKIRWYIIIIIIYVIIWLFIFKRAELMVDWTNK